MHAARRPGIAYLPADMRPHAYTGLLYGHLAEHGLVGVPGKLRVRWLWRARRHVGVVHFHWNPHREYEFRRRPRVFRRVLTPARFAVFAARLASARLLGYRIAWTIHEVYPHETLSRRIDRAAARLLARQAHTLFAHDPETAERARAELGLALNGLAVVPHGSFAAAFQPRSARADVRRAHGLAPDSFVFLAFGELRRYKNLALLLDAFAALERDDVELLVAGRCWDESLADELRRRARRDPRLKLRLEYVPDEEVGDVFAAGDAFVLAREDGWTSGSLILAVSLGVPAVAARRPAYESLLGDGDAGWLFTPGDVRSLAEALAAAASDPAAARAKGEAGRRRSERLDWPTAAAQTAAMLVPERRA